MLPNNVMHTTITAFITLLLLCFIDPKAMFQFKYAHKWGSGFGWEDNTLLYTVVVDVSMWRLESDGNTDTKKSEYETSSWGLYSVHSNTINHLKISASLYKYISIYISLFGWSDLEQKGFASSHPWYENHDSWYPSRVLSYNTHMCASCLHCVHVGFCVTARHWLPFKLSNHEIHIYDRLKKIPLKRN
jgi:hypothetical protein